MIALLALLAAVSDQSWTVNTFGTDLNRADGAAAVWNGRLYVGGGYNGTAAVAAVQYTPLGADGFARLARLAPAGTPVIAIGGITAANAAALARVGAAGVAVIGAVWSASEPADAARALRAAFP